MLKLDYTEYLFRADYLLERRCEQYKDSLIFASFTAWQIGTQNGLKINWKRYLEDLNLIEKEKLDIDEKRELTETSLRIMKKLGKI